METDRAQVIAERLHAGDREEDGIPILWHVRRVARRTPAEARSVAWLHEVLEFTAVTEQRLLQEGVTSEELRALRLLHRTADTRSDRIYLAHLELIARAAGRSGDLARMVKIADLEDRRLHPRVRPDGWSPPYELGLQLLRPRPMTRTAPSPPALTEKPPARDRTEGRGAPFRASARSTPGS